MDRNTGSGVRHITPRCVRAFDAMPGFFFPRCALFPCPTGGSAPGKIHNAICTTTRETGEWLCCFFFAQREREKCTNNWYTNTRRKKEDKVGKAAACRRKKKKGFVFYFHVHTTSLGAARAIPNTNRRRERRFAKFDWSVGSVPRVSLSWHSAPTPEIFSLFFFPRRFSHFQRRRFNRNDP